MTTPIDVRRKIYGSILVSETIWLELRKWRDFFKISQSDLAKAMNVSPSVVSDYENGRQKHPGSRFIKRYVENLLRLDGDRGGHNTRILGAESGPGESRAVIDIKEYRSPLPARSVVEATRSQVLVNERLLDLPLHGHTVVDSIAAILAYSGNAFYELYGRSTERVLVFLRVSMGRSPLVAIRVHPLKPRMVVLHGPVRVDSLAQKIAEKESIILAVSREKKVEALVKGLQALN